MKQSYEYEFEYDSKYCYPESKVLKNKLDIRDADQLNEAERKITLLRAMETLQKGIRESCDYEHLKRIHKFLFGDLYQWAGKSRQVLCQRLSYYFGEINAIHPFREGNGRAQRMFFQFLCRNLGYDLDFSLISSEDMLKPVSGHLISIMTCWKR